MTLKELNIIKEALKNPTCPCRNCPLYREDALEIIEREIKLKTINPVDGKVHGWIKNIEPPEGY